MYDLFAHGITTSRGDAMGFFKRMFGRKEGGEQIEVRNEAHNPLWGEKSEESRDVDCVVMYSRKPPRQNSDNLNLSHRATRETLSFHVSSQKLDEMLALCNQLESQRSDVIRASLELAMPIFKNHPDLFVQFKTKSKEGW
jgi:hypothetical protein